MNDDTISRRVAIDALKVAYWDDDIQAAKDDPCVIDVMTCWAIWQIKALPSAEKRGKWIAVENDIDYYPFMCSECHETVIKKTNYCPNCGSYMNMEDENE